MSDLLAFLCKALATDYLLALFYRVSFISSKLALVSSTDVK